MSFHVSDLGWWIIHRATLCANRGISFLLQHPSRSRKHLTWRESSYLMQNHVNIAAKAFAKENRYTSWSVSQSTRLKVLRNTLGWYLLIAFSMWNFSSDCFYLWLGRRKKCDFQPQQCVSSFDRNRRDYFLLWGIIVESVKIDRKTWWNFMKFE